MRYLYPVTHQNGHGIPACDPNKIKIFIYAGTLNVKTKYVCTWNKMDKVQFTILNIIAKRIHKGEYQGRQWIFIP